MSEVEKDVPELSLLDQLKIQHTQFLHQKELAQNNLNQLVGAVYACELMIKNHEAEDVKKGISQASLGGQGNGEVDKQAPEQTA